MLLVIRLFCLQILKGSDFLTIADENRIRMEKIPAPRGIIYDRQEKALVRNIPVYQVKSSKSKVKSLISKEEALKMEMGGEELEMGLAREYPEGEIFASVLGYVDAEMVGRSGVEAVYNEVLTGEDGARLVETDAQGEVLHEIGKRQPISGENIHLSIDSDLQRKVLELMKGKKGGVVVSNPQNGQILALVSTPTFDPNLFSQGKQLDTRRVQQGDTRRVSDVEDLLEDSDQPLFNRAIGGGYPPGSIFKIITATAGLEEGKIDKNTRIEDTGEIRVGEYRYGNWYFDQYGRKEGALDIIGAIRRSNDIFFYRVGEYVGATKLVAWAKKFGLSRLTEIDLVGEEEGWILDPYEKEKQTGESWFLGNTYHLSIGQGDLQVTPLQANMMTNVIANGGKLCLPRVKKEERDCQDLGLKQETIDLIAEGMKQACQTGGTGFPLFNFKPQVACKTGTAEFGPPVGGPAGGPAGGEDKTHAWFTVFAPVDPPVGGPEISVTVLLEAGGEGSRDAAPIAKEILAEWFGR